MNDIVHPLICVRGFLCELELALAHGYSCSSTQASPTHFSFCNLTLLQCPSPLRCSEVLHPACPASFTPVVGWARPLLQAFWAFSLEQQTLAICVLLISSMALKKAALTLVLMVTVQTVSGPHPGGISRAVQLQPKQSHRQSQ